MARFGSLSEVGLVLVDVITAAVGLTTTLVHLTAPIDDAEAATASVQVTLLWTTPQPGHRNDSPERTPAGLIEPPPPTLSVWYMVSTTGLSTDANHAIDAHDLLGKVIRAFHVVPVLTLPLVISGPGEGRLKVVQVPIDADLSEKIWMPLQVRQRPWALFDVGPVQLMGAASTTAAGPVVGPGGPRLSVPTTASRPRIERITPAIVSEGGRIRLDATYTGVAPHLRVNSTPAVSPALTPLEAGGPLLATLPAALTAGAYDVTLLAGGPIPSEPITLTVVAPTVPALDAPTQLRHARTAPLTLTGRALGTGEVQVVFWPDIGVTTPADLVSVKVTPAGNSLTIPVADLAPLRNRLYRVSVRLAPQTFTPHVLIEVTP